MSNHKINDLSCFLTQIHMFWANMPQTPCHAKRVFLSAPNTWWGSENLGAPNLHLLSFISTNGVFLLAFLQEHREKKIYIYIYTVYKLSWPLNPVPFLRTYTPLRKTASNPSIWGSLGILRVVMKPKVFEHTQMAPWWFLGGKNMRQWRYWYINLVKWLLFIYSQSTRKLIGKPSKHGQKIQKEELGTLGRVP